MIGPGANVGVDGISLPSNRPAPEDKPSLSSRIGLLASIENVPRRTSSARGFSKSVRGAHSPAIRHFPRTGTLACSFGCVLGSCTAPTSSPAGATPDPLHLTFQGVKAGCPDGLHYDVKGNLWAAAARLGGILQIDPRGIILGFVPVPNGDLSTTNFAFGGPDNRDIFLEGAISGTFWRFKAPNPGLIGPGGVRLPAQP